MENSDTKIRRLDGETEDTRDLLWLFTLTRGYTRYLLEDLHA